MQKRLKEAEDHSAHYRDRFYLQQYVLILSNSGIRVGEARRLCWQDISSTQTTEGEQRPVFTVDGKTGVRDVVCNAWVNDY